MALATIFQFKLITPARELFNEPVKQVIIPTQLGQITVLPEHAPIVSVLAAGELVVTTAEKEFPLAVSGGVLEMFQNTLVILADTAEHPTEIDVAAAEARAQELEKQVAASVELDIGTYNTLLHNLERERARLAVGKKWRR